MGRKVQPRDSYEPEAGYLLRLIQAIEVDTKGPPQWRKEQIERLNEAAQSFLQESARRKRNHPPRQSLLSRGRM